VASLQEPSSEKHIHTMKFKSEINYSNEGWIILTFPLFKLHVNKVKNESILYMLTDIPIEQKNELNSLFENKLEFIKEFIENLGMNYYSLAIKDTQTCFIATGVIRPFVYTKVIFRFFGYLSDSMVESEYSWVESYQDIDYSIKLSTDNLDKEKMVLQIDYKEIDAKPATNIAQERNAG